MLGNRNMPASHEGGEKSTQRKILEGGGMVIGMVVLIGANVIASIKGVDPVNLMREQEKQTELEQAHALLPKCEPAAPRVRFAREQK